MAQKISATAAVETIEDLKLRTQIACTIWWDYYSNREGKKAWRHLDRFLAAWTKDISTTASDHRATLVQCGYTMKLAEERVPDNHSLFRQTENQQSDNEIEDIDRAVHLKHEHNRGRTYRHGGKKS